MKTPRTVAAPDISILSRDRDDPKWDDDENANYRTKLSLIYTLHAPSQQYDRVADSGGVLCWIH